MKHPMEVISSWKFNERESDTNCLRALEELIESVRYYFSPENMPTDEEVEKAANQFCDDSFDLTDPEEKLKSLGAYCGYVDGYKAAIERMKR